MGKHLDKLLTIAGPALGGAVEALPQPLASLAGDRATDLTRLLGRRNGFYAFESALHVFGVAAGPPEQSLEAWNAADTWRNEYGALAEGCLFFAEDLFGGQFCLRDGRVLIFDPETGDTSPLAEDLEGFAKALLADYQVLTGHPLARRWQQRHGALPPGHRLCPRRPFVAGGEFELANLGLVEAVAGMRLRGELARQIHDLPDGQSIRIKLID